MQVGVHADKLHNLLSEEKFESRPNAADVGNGIKRRPWDGTSQDRNVAQGFLSGAKPQYVPAARPLHSCQLPSSLVFTAAPPVSTAAPRVSIGCSSSAAVSGEEEEESGWSISENDLLAILPEKKISA